MIEDDLRSLRQVLARAIDASGLQRRDIERALEIRNGSLGNLLNGSLDLRVEHLTLLASVLRIPPSDLLMMGCPETRAAATHRLSDWIGPNASAPNAAAPTTAAANLPPDDLAEMIRKAIREELARNET
jgi:transcriptional regulator with XRE-family HTH domain